MRNKIIMKDRLKQILFPPPPAGPYGLLARFVTAGDLVRAAAALRQAGYRRFEAYSPYPVHGLDRAMGSRFSLVPLLALGGGATGALAGLALQVYVHVFNYPLVIGGKPLLSIPAFIPVMFELTILLAAFGAVFGMFLINGLPLLYHPLLKRDPFLKVTDDGFFIAVESRDALFDEVRTRHLLETAGGQGIEWVEP